MGYSILSERKPGPPGGAAPSAAGRGRTPIQTNAAPHRDLRRAEIHCILIPVAIQYAEMVCRREREVTSDKFLSFDEALSELQMATNELRSLVSSGKIVPEGVGLELNFRQSQIEELKKRLKESGHPELRISRPEVAKGWSRETGLIVWRGSASEVEWILLKLAPQDWNHIGFRLFFDARSTLGRIGIAAGDRAFIAETNLQPAKWHSFLIEMFAGRGQVVIDDKQVFAGQLDLPFVGLCGSGASELSMTRQDTAIFRGLKVEQLNPE